jgi:hypothetical protein
VIENASTADGDDLPLRVFTNSTIGFGSERVAAITCFPEDDLLFVANHNRRQIMVFANASTLEGPVDVTNQVYAVSSIENAAFYREGG